MVADKKKYAEFIKNTEVYDIWKGLSPQRKHLSPLKYVFNAFSKITRPSYFLNLDEFGDNQGHWVDAGAERTCEMLEKAGYKVLDFDMGLLPRDPIIHFIKP